jgi:hypothetical protein
MVAVAVAPVVKAAGAGAKAAAEVPHTPTAVAVAVAAAAAVAAALAAADLPARTARWWPALGAVRVTRAADGKGDRPLSWLLEKIYSQKLLLALLVVTLLTAGFAVAFFFSTASNSPNWLKRVPWEGLTGAGLGVVFIGFTYERIVRSEWEDYIREVLRNALSQETFLLRQNDDALEGLIVSALGARLRDAALAKEWYESSIDPLQRLESRRHDYRCFIELESLPPSTGLAARNFYQAYVEIRYRGRLPKTSFSLTAVPTTEAYESLVETDDWEFIAIAEPAPPFLKLGRDLFDVEYVRVNRQALEHKVLMQDGNVVHLFRSDALQKLVGTEVDVEYKYKLKVQKFAHIYSHFLDIPTRNVEIDFDFASTEIRYVNVSPFFASSAKPEIRGYPNQARPHRISVEVPGWVIPRSGVLFAWILGSEDREDFRNAVLTAETARGASVTADPSPET